MLGDAIGYLAKTAFCVGIAREHMEVGEERTHADVLLVA
jgi:hypothetical protein